MISKIIHKNIVLKMKNKEASCGRAQLAGTKIPFATFNVASGSGIAFVEVARRITNITKTKLEMVEWPKDRAAIETGDFIADCSPAAEALGWSPKTGFDQGLEKTFAYYREHLTHYLK